MPEISASSCLRVPRRLVLEIGEPARDALEARPPERLGVRKILQRRKMLLAKLDQLADHVIGELVLERRREIADGAVNDVASVPRTRRRVDLVERAQAEDMPGVDRIGIAQPQLDLRDRQRRRPHMSAAASAQAARARLAGCRRVEHARKRDITRAALQRGLPARLARDRGEPLHEARRHRRRAAELGRAGEDHLGRAERLREIVRREADAPLRQVEAELVAHRPAEPGIAARLRRPDALDQPAQHQAIDRLQARFERAVDAHPHVGFGPADFLVGDRGVEQLDIIAGLDRRGAGLRQSRRTPSPVPR